MKTRYNYLILLFLMVFSGVAQSQEILNQYLKIAAENNPGLRARFNQYLAALEVAPQVGTLPDPQFAFGYFIQPVETRVGPQNAKISLTQMFPWFGTLGAKEDVAVHQAKAKYEAFEETKSKLFYDVKASYYNLYFTEKAIQKIRENIDILNSFNVLALIKVEAGLASAVDELRIEMEIADLENQLALLRDQYFVQLVEFNNLLDNDENTEVEIPDSLWAEEFPYDKQSLLDSIYTNNHQLLSYDFQFQSFVSKEQASRKSGLPAFSVGVDYIFIGKSENPALEAKQSGKDAILFPKIGLTIPLYRKKYNAMVNEAVYLQKSVTNQKVEKKNVLETLFENTNKNYKDADRRLDLNKRQSILANQAMQILQTEYSTQNKNFEEILRMERRLLKYTLELEKARADKNAAVAFMEYLMGK
ncbi:MAG: transporter [Bacteroidetes bacterium 4572_114]|nr:MAG: transporter [Bacteroidetes bacterium 4572_114]